MKMKKQANRSKRLKQNDTIWSRIFDVCNVIVLIACGFITVAPFIYVFACSVATEQEILTRKFFLIPHTFQPESYKYIFSSITLPRAFGNTVFITLVGTALAMFLTVTLAYPLSKKRLWGRSVLLSLISFTLVFSGGMIPTFLVIKGLHMIDSFAALIIPSALSTWNLIVIKNFFEGLPAELEDAAKIDGANDLTVFFKMVIPLSKPIIMTIALFVAITHWNSWFDAYLFTNAQSLKTMQSILVEILNQYQTSSANQAANQASQTITPDSIRMAATMIATIPIIMVYPFIQKYFVKGIMLGSVKS